MNPTSSKTLLRVMTPRRTSLPLAAAALAPTLAMLSAPAHAYVGPGAGLGVLGTLFGIVAAIVLALFGLFWYPLKRAFGKRSTANGAPSAELPPSAAASTTPAVASTVVPNATPITAPNATPAAAPGAVPSSDDGDAAHPDTMRRDAAVGEGTVAEGRDGAR